jgi:acylphosphatase
MARIAIKITGKVQGVYFRKYAQWKAEELKLTGLVRNEEDGTVYIEAQGSEADVDALAKWCKLGSPLAKVESVSSEALPEVVDETLFIIEQQ